MTTSSTRDRVAVPAAALQVVGALGILTGVGLAVMAVVGWLAERGRQGSVVDGSEQVAQAIGIAFAMVGFGALASTSIVVLLGARRMARLRSYPFAVGSAVLAMLPVNGCFVLGLPVGIWCLLVLTRPDVREAFDGARQEPDDGFWDGDPP